MQGTNQSLGDYPQVTRPGSNGCGRSGLRGSTRTENPYCPLAAHGTAAPKTADPFDPGELNGRKRVAFGAAISPKASRVPWYSWTSTSSGDSDPRCTRART